MFKERNEFTQLNFKGRKIKYSRRIEKIKRKRERNEKNK